MQSYVAVTKEIDDVELAAKELLQQIAERLPLKKRSAGILFCYSDMDMEGLVGALEREAGFEILGCSAIANMDEREGFHNMAATLTVLTCDDCGFALAASDPITPENVDAEIEKTCRTAAEKLGERPKLLFVLPPYILEIMLDAYSMGFNRVAPGIPVMGGLPSYNADEDENATFFGGKTSPDRLVLLAMGGNVRPVFCVQNVTSGDASRKREVTRSKDNVVYEVGGQPFTDYLREIGMPVEKLTQGNNTVTFVANPILLESSSEAGGEFSFVRTLHEIDLEEGSGTAIGQIPAGATLSICPLQKDQIEAAAGEGMRILKEKMQEEEKKGYRFSTILAVSCIGRHLLMLPNNDAEVRRLLGELPPGVTLSGFYSYGELGPQGTSQTKNFAHNESLILCAF